jgi:uncharacterized protein
VTDTGTIAPVRDRIAAIDTVRGVAVLGILAMNVQSFAMIGAAYFFPTAYGDLTGANHVVWLLSALLAHRKFMTIFSMLFGAGLILQWHRAGPAIAAGARFAGLWYRRMFWLLVIGLVHAYALWYGDILVAYAVCGCLIYPLRRLSAGWLVVLGLALLAVGSGLSVLAGVSAPHWPQASLDQFTAGWQPAPAKVAEEVAAMRGGWLAQNQVRVPASLFMQTFVFVFSTVWRASGCMLLGMALMKGGYLTGGRPRAYRSWIVVALAVGVPVSLFGIRGVIARDWEPVYTFFLGSQYGYWGSLPVAFGWLGLALLACHNDWWPGLRRRLAAVGRTALSCYLLQTLICTTLFYGHGFGLFGRVSRVGQAGVTVAVWIVLLWLAPWWLDRYRFGPMEWLWRALAYRCREPLRRRVTPHG